MLFVLNGIFLFVALLLVGFGFFLEVEYVKFEHATDDKFGSTPASVIVIGTLMLFVSAVGLWGITRKSKCLTGFYGVTLIIFLIVQIVLVVSPIVAGPESEKVLEKAALKTMSEWDGAKGAISKSWNAIQSNLDCCGVRSFQDWSNSTAFQSQAKKHNAQALIPVPDSCCIEYASECGLNWSDVEELKNKGCIAEIEGWVQTHVSVLSGALAIICVTELFAMVIAFQLVRSGFTYEMIA